MIRTVLPLLLCLAAGGCSSSTMDAPHLAGQPDAAPAADLLPEPFVLASPAFHGGGTLPMEFTCDGVGHSPPLFWSGTPAGTVELALMMTTQAKDGLKWNWVLFRVPPGTRELAVGSMGVGLAGLTSDGPNLAYSPPCSQGPGLMRYTFTLHALSAVPSLPAQPRSVTGTVLTAAIANLTLASSSLDVTYTR